jgi:hypothetical protein
MPVDALQQIDFHLLFYLKNNRSTGHSQRQGSPWLKLSLVPQITKFIHNLKKR